MKEKFVIDTSSIIHGVLREFVEKEKNIEIIIPVAVIDELQAQASKGREPGFIGLEEIKKVREIAEKKKIKISFVGERPSLEEIKLARSGRIDALIRDVAKKENATLLTGDFVQALVAEAEGVKVKHIPHPVKLEGLEFEKFFTNDTMSIHLKEGVVPLAKRGVPGNFKLVKIREEPLDRKELEKIIKEILEATRISETASVEIVRNGATVIQFGNYRISIAQPPFSDGLELTVVRPLVKLSLEDYKLSEKLMKRLKERAEGILIAGPPGSGKSTLASSLAEFYKNQGKIVKTLESPKDLQVGPEITQYGPLEGDFEKTADILLLVRPDYSVYDEVRKTRDFEIFSDLRLAGVGMIGVVHSADAIGALQRFIGRVELGVIPHVIDTIIFVKDGEVRQVLELNIVVKVPTGMTEEDLARPVVEVRDFETGELVYEIYTFGEENVIVPIDKKVMKHPIRKLAAERILEEIKRFDSNAKVEIVNDNKAIVKVDNRIIPRIIGRDGETIKKIEDKLGIHIEVEPRIPSLGKEVYFRIDESGNSINFSFDKSLIGRIANIYLDDEFLFSATIGKKASIKVSKDSDIGRELIKAIVSKKKIKVIV
jgi:ATPase